MEWVSVDKTGIVHDKNINHWRHAQKTQTVLKILDMEGVGE